VEEKSKPLAALLIEQKALSPEHRAPLDALVDAHLQQHNNDADQSLATLSSHSSAQRWLASIADADVQGALGSLAPPGTRSPATDDSDPEATISSPERPRAQSVFAFCGRMPPAASVACRSPWTAKSRAR
jgi:hypothetical protein